LNKASKRGAGPIDPVVYKKRSAMPVPPLDFEFPLADVIKVVVLVVGWTVTIVKIDSRLKNVEKDIKGVTGELKEVSQLSRWRERMEERITTQRRDIDELRHGRGFIRNGVDGEYADHGKLSEK
jgi:hypothetical protein